MILGHGGLELRARAFIAEAKCFLSDPSFSGILFILNKGQNTTWCFDIWILGIFQIQNTIYKICQQI